MGDVLKYRIPNQDKISKTGNFVRLKTDEIPSGFVVTSFRGDACYQFVESADETQSFAFDNNSSFTTVLDYKDSAIELIKYLKDSGGKAVLSRIKLLQIRVNPSTFYDHLCEEYPNAFVYLISSPLFGTWIGATPETLLERTGDKGKTMALAGTRKTESKDPWTQKEYEEHQLVADFIEENARESELQGILRFDREELQSGPVRHLLTRFEFTLSQNQDWKFTKSLHPTPAVSGFPRDRALEIIEKIESHDRSLYTGIIGLLDDQTNLYVNLRCAQITENETLLYLGGGFTKDSVVEDEWMETENKAKTLLNVLKKQ